MELTKTTREVLEDLYLKKRLSTLEVGKFLKVSDHTAQKWLKYYGIKTRSLSETSTKYPKTAFSGDLKEKAYMLGLRTGDLYAIHHRKLIKVEATSSQLIFIRMFKKVFDKYDTVRVYERKGKITEKSFRVYCYPDSSFEFLVEKLNEIPEFIANENEYFLSFLAGYSDAEGSWIIANHIQKVGRSKDSIFSLGSCDKAILYQIHKKLKGLGFNSHIYLSKKAGTSTQLGKYHSDFYRIRLYGKCVAKLAELILPFSHHENKQKSMEEIIELEKTKIENLGTIEIPCLYCGHKKVHKCSSYGYKGIRYKRYRCPICKRKFSEQTIKKLCKKGELCQ